MPATNSKMSLSAFLDRADRTITAICPVGATVLGISSIYYVAFSYGMGVIALIFGKEGATRVITSASQNALVVLVGVPMIPLGLVALEAADVEGRALELWREKVSPVLPQIPVLGWLIEWLWPAPTREPLASSQTEPGGTIDYVARSIGAGLLLPFMAHFVGRLCFKSVESNPKRVVMGGILFFTVKALLKMYLRQQEFRRQGFRRVLNYDPSWEV